MADVEEIQENLGENLIFHDYSLRENEKTRLKQQVAVERKTFLGSGVLDGLIFSIFSM